MGLEGEDVDMLNLFPRDSLLTASKCTFRATHRPAGLTQVGVINSPIINRGGTNLQCSTASKRLDRWGGWLVGCLAGSPLLCLVEMPAAVGD